MIELGAQSNHFKQLHGAIPGFSWFYTQDMDGGLSDVFQRSTVGKEVEPLEYHSYFAPDSTHVLRVGWNQLSIPSLHVSQRLAFDQDASLIDSLKGHQHSEQRRLT
ncbi:hypothetical protein DW66_1179 [Pseudomonas putida]|nr:hypothetical protein DW66_1179 [Pseudomonas putida]